MSVSILEFSIYYNYNYNYIFNYNYRLSSPDTLSLALSEAPCPDPGSPEHLVSRRAVLDRVTSHPGPARYRSSRHVSKVLCAGMTILHIRMCDVMEAR